MRHSVTANLLLAIMFCHQLFLPSIFQEISIAFICCHRNKRAARKTLTTLLFHKFIARFFLRQTKRLYEEDSLLSARGRIVGTVVSTAASTGYAFCGELLDPGCRSGRSGAGNRTDGVSQAIMPPYQCHTILNIALPFAGE